MPMTSRTASATVRYNWQGSVGVAHQLLRGVGLEVAYFRTSYGNFTVTDNTLVSPADFDSFSITAPKDPRLPDGEGRPSAASPTSSRRSSVSCRTW